MPVVFNIATSGRNSSASATSATWSHTTTTSANRLMVVGVSMVSTASRVVTVVYNAASFLAIGSAIPISDAAGSIEMWRLVNPATGANTVEVKLSSGSRFVGAATTFSDVDQTAPVGTFVSATSNNSALSINVASAVDDLVIDALGTEGRVLTVGSGQTKRWDLESTGAGTNAQGAGSTEAGAASVTMSWTMDGNNVWVIGGASVKALISAVAVLEDESYVMVA